MPENQTTAHQTELQITSNGKSLDVDYTLEDLPLDFNIKGNTVVNVLWNMQENNYISISTIGNNQTMVNDRFVFRDNTNVGRGWYTTYLSKKHMFEPNTTYTITYHIRKIQGANNIKFTGGGVNIQIPREVGIHSFTFNTNSTSFFTGNVHFIEVQLMSKTSSDPIDEWDIEILNCIKGEVPCKNRIEGVESVGGRDGLQITTQLQRPILGEYTLQGDVPQQIGFIEDKMKEHDLAYEIVWI